MARIPLVEPEELEDDYPRIADINYIRALANSSGAVSAAAEYVSSLRSLIPGTVSEVAILAVARAKDSTFIWHHHVSNALEQGVTRETIRNLGARRLDQLDDKERTIVDFVQAQTRGEMTDELFESLNEHLSNEDMIVISRFAANYAGTADFIATFDVELDEPFVGWVPE